MANLPFQLEHFTSADSLWDALSPTRTLTSPRSKLIYRGQENADWKLIPTVLRGRTRTILDVLARTKPTADDQVFFEGVLLDTFVEHCDRIGIRIPNDSLDFRRVLSKRDPFYINPPRWPSDDFLEIMALAQHHKIPTRLLDWTSNPYVAIYFAASSALGSICSGKPHARLAIWVLDTVLSGPYRDVRILQMPGSISPHLAAQSGVFTVHPHKGARGEQLRAQGLEDEFASAAPSPLRKLTVPFTECTRLVDLCHNVGFGAATMYPSADGAGMAVMENLNLWMAKSGRPRPRSAPDGSCTDDGRDTSTTNS